MNSTRSIRSSHGDMPGSLTRGLRYGKIRCVNYANRIVCLTEETTEWLYLLGEEARIVGISGYTVRPRRAQLRGRSTRQTKLKLASTF